MKALLLLFVLMISGCATFNPSSKSCKVGVIETNGLPCWLNSKPQNGVVVSMPEHVDPTKTREFLFKKALLEIAAAKTGLTVSEDSIVKKRTKVTGNDNVSQQIKVITLATVKTTNGSINVKAKVEDEWKHPSSRKLYLWVVPVE